MPKQNILTRSKKKQALALFQANRLVEARRLFEKICAADRSDAEAWMCLGVICSTLGELPQGETHCRRAITLKPDYAHAHYNLANILVAQKRPAEALAGYDQVLRSNPGHVQAHNNRGNALASLDRSGEALAAYETALALQPDSAETYTSLYFFHMYRGEVDEALTCLREAHRLDPRSSAATYSSYLFSLNYHHEWTPQAIFEEHRRWGEKYAPRLETPPVHTNTREPERRLKIGYVSPDLREHSVAFFIEPVLANHDHREFEIHVYAEVSQPDATSARLREQVAYWHDTVGIPDEQLARKIRDDGIDILVDMAGHSAGNRLGVFALRPAPVQASFIGYPNTTGLPAMDYRITNSLTTPQYLDPYFTETVMRLPYANCFNHPADCPPVTAPPVLASGRVTFGCFNNVAKLAPPVIALWAEVLKAVPGARLFLKSQPFDDPGVRELFLARFAAHGIGPERLLLRGAEPFQDYLRSFNDIDIALDPFPYNGSTTNYHALWMGVPVVALEGRSAISRMSYGVLATLGLEELAAKTAAEYVTIAVDLAADPDRLRALRASLRERMLASPLKDGRRYTAALEDLYRDMWRNWCDRAS